MSGSLAWRLERGETGAQKASHTLIKPTTSEIACGILHLQYCCASDKYYRSVVSTAELSRFTNCARHVMLVAHDDYVLVCRPYCAGDEKVSDGWQSLVYEADDVMRKEESDWKMVYLARREGTREAKVSWKFDSAGQDNVHECFMINALVLGIVGWSCIQIGLLSRQEVAW